MDSYDSIYIGGTWVASRSGAHIAVENPATEEIISRVPDSGPADVDLAVRAARDAFDPWSALSRAERAGHLAAVLDRLTARKEEMAHVISSEMGAPITLAIGMQVGLPLRVLQSYLDLLRDDLLRDDLLRDDLLRDGEQPQRLGNSLVLAEPVGVVGAITPWNYPLHQAVAKIAAALAAGCTVVHKPSEVAPLSAYLFAQITHEAGLPPGVYNLIPGAGQPAGEALASHCDVDMISFTGSTRAGRRVGALAAATVKRVALELGGKSANVVLPDGDLTGAVKVGVANCMLNSGQTCTALSRLLVPANRVDEALGIAETAMAKYRPGDPTEPKTRLGPLVSAAQRERVTGYVERGLAEGAKLVVDGREGMPERGYYFGPTLFTDVGPHHTIAQEEIFGPVLSVLTYTDEDDAARIANATAYGLAGAVWSSDVDRAIAFARRLRTGQVDINGAAFNHLAPFGGYRQSGNGRELGQAGLAEFCEVKAIQLPVR